MQLSDAELAKFVIQQAVLNEKLSGAVETITKDMHTMVQSMKNQEVLLEKIGSIEKESNERNKRIHHRLDGVDNVISIIQESRNTKGCPSLQRSDDKINSLEERLLDPDNGIIPAIREQLKEERESRKWLWRTLVTIVLGALITLLFSSFKAG